MFDGSGSGVVEIFDFDLEEGFVVGRGGGIVNHRLDADLVVFFDAIAETRNGSPIGELAAGAEDVFFLVGAEKIGAIFIPERDMMENFACDGISGGVDEMRVVRQQPPSHGSGPSEIGRLRHLHVRSVSGQIHGADAESDSVRSGVNFLVEDDALCDKVMHAALHEAAAGFVGAVHVTARRCGSFLCGSEIGNCGGKCGDENETGKHGAPREIEGGLLLT